MHLVFVDSNVLGSRTLYDWLFMLRVKSHMFSLATTPDVLDEAHKVWRKKHPAAGGADRMAREQKWRTFIDDVVEDWDGGAAPEVVDKHDQHVHNAAMYCAADILLTSNVSDFGDPDQLPYDLYAPDEFFCLVNENAPFLVLEVTRKQNEYWQNKRDSGESLKRLPEALREEPVSTKREYRSPRTVLPRAGAPS